MNILCIGDIVGKPGRKAVNDLLTDLKKELAIDLVIANAENSAGGSGVTARIADDLFAMGCDVLTLGDHVWDQQDIVEYLKKNPKIVRPANFPEGTPGQGWCVVTLPSQQKVGVINLLGRVFMRYNLECPFRMARNILDEIKKVTDIIVVDIHAEATSEKVAMGSFLDGSASIVFGTHTHIQTADDKILPKGTAYITDLGMTGPYDSVIGQKKDQIIQRFLTSIPIRFEVAENDVYLCGIVVDVDEKTGKARSINRVQRRAA